MQASSKAVAADAAKNQILNRNGYISIVFQKNMSKKPFVLLELLIAFALVTFTILPFLRYPYQDVKQQLNCLFSLELQRHAQRELAKWEAALYSGDKDLLDRVFNAKVSKAQMDRDNCLITLQLADKMKRHYHRKLLIYPSAQKRSKDNSNLSLVRIEVEYFEPKKLNVPLLKAKRVIFCKCCQKINVPAS